GKIIFQTRMESTLMPDPYASLPAAWRRKLMWISSGLSILILLIFNTFAAPLTTPAAPLGMISFQLAGTPQRLQALLASWDSAARQIAAFCLGLDYLFMPAYALAISLADRWVGEGLRQRGLPLAPAGIPLAWGVWLGALLDALENGLQAAMLFGSANPALPGITRVVAVVKFGLVFAGLGYVFYGLAARLVARSTSPAA
ncbi:MAG TPA: hypothetical protein VN363_00370, partial [Anaerolineales bacterium]|nr:hypothetical protein [Anaerolineales bacterium]